LRNKAVVLMYHRVLSEEEASRYPSQVGMMVKNETFRKQMKYIKKHFRPIPLGDFVDHLHRGIPFHSKTCLVTFDDGWRDNFINAYPILKENKIPAVIFLPTDFVGSNRHFWQGEITDILLSIRGFASKDTEFGIKVMKTLDHKFVRDIISCNDGDLPENLNSMLAGLKKNAITEIEKLIQALRDILPCERTLVEKESDFLAWDEVRLLAREGIAFGSHGKSHVLLPAISGREVLKEISESKQEIEKQIGQPIDSFSYPNGNYNEVVTEAVKTAGYQVTFGTEMGHFSVNDDSFRVKRINIHEDMTGTIPMLLCRVTGVW
jgi:peptidoglycan/xylan/chitin deacetylase (PgdA/CDA1 family)